MKNLTPKFDFDDILIIPKKKTHITSRYKDIKLQKNLPLITAPMDTVVNLNNLDVFLDKNINVTLPRTIKYEEFKYWVRNRNIAEYSKNVFISFGFEDLDVFHKNNFQDLHENAHILIDVANGHMQKIMDYACEIKRLRPDIVIMVGNIANPETYLWYAEQECVDYIRVGIGNGCFIGGTKVTTKNGLKKIEDLIEGDEVLTHSGKYKPVVSTKKRNHNEDLIKINNIVCTPNHEFYVLNKKYENIVTDDNIVDLCEWVSAKELSQTNEYLLIEIDTHYENEIKL